MNGKRAKTKNGKKKNGKINATKEFLKYFSLNALLIFSESDWSLRLLMMRNPFLTLKSRNLGFRLDALILHVFKRCFPKNALKILLHRSYIMR